MSQRNFERETWCLCCECSGFCNCISDTFSPCCGWCGGIINFITGCFSWVFALFCCNLNKGRPIGKKNFFPNNVYVLLPIAFALGGFILSVSVNAGCRFFSRECFRSSDDTKVDCDIAFPNDSDISGDFYGISNFETDGTCSDYPGDDSFSQDTLTKLSQIFSVVAIIVGFFTFFSMLTMMCFKAHKHLTTGTGIAGMVACIFQGLTFLSMASDFCVHRGGNSVDSYHDCAVQKNGYVSLGAAMLYLVSSIGCFLIDFFQSERAEKEKLRSRSVSQKSAIEKREDAVPTVGSERFKADMRQYGGLLLMFSAMVLVVSLTSIVDASKLVSKSSQWALDVFDLISAVCLCMLGIGGVLVGYLALVADSGNSELTGTTIVLTQFGWLPLIGRVIQIFLDMSSDPSNNKFIDKSYNPDTLDVMFFGWVGIIATVAYVGTFVGSLAFFQFSIYAYQVGRAVDRPSSYYKSRALYYNFLLLLAGSSLAISGVYILRRHDAGPLSPPINIANIYVVTYPEMSIFVGVLQVVIAFTGFARCVRLHRGFNTSHSFQVKCFLTWIFMVVIQILVQLGHDGSNTVDISGSTLGCLFLALIFMPAFLDFKMYETPKKITLDFYDNAYQVGEFRSMFVRSRLNVPPGSD
mmetsp:Transcript_19495/g.28675  ORF Transcript_19495/g.28675 Transcript_19495/m.28675 type:complete len:636 (-) Transcript_19495:99-2006(-)